MFVVYAVVTGDTSNTALQRGFVTFHMTEEVLDERGVVSAAEREREWESAWDEALIRVERLSDEEIQRRSAEYREADLALAEAEWAADDEVDAELASAADEYAEDLGYDEAESSGDGIFGAFIAASFRLHHLVFMVLAVITAYGIGSRGRGGGS